jgi:hypothetical protein
MNDITCLYYTSNVLPEECAENVRRHLLQQVEGEIPIVSVSKKPLDFGTNICVGSLEHSYYSCYRQILIGAKTIKTKYTACCEDDTLYSMEHFSNRPAKDTFSYNKNMWYAEKDCFWHKHNVGMCTCIVETETLIKTLEARFVKYPSPIHRGERKERYFQEPGRNDKKFDIPNAKTEYFRTEIPILTFNYFKALGGKARWEAHQPVTTTDLEPWGNCKTLKVRFWGYL